MEYWYQLRMCYRFFEIARPNSNAKERWKFVANYVNNMLELEMNLRDTEERINTTKHLEKLLEGNNILLPLT